MNGLIKIISQWQREQKTGTIQPNFFKGGISSVKLKESPNKLNASGGYFMLDNEYSLDVLEERISAWMTQRKVGNITMYCSCGTIVGIQEETTIKL
ncbi:unnamed protein product [marine sediment metagenome]|uniref:Uncharacterized protein n=1 Tax=marine sediment metagenome TaxID=412755 RepID=X0SUJ3_9ZZZZ